MKIDEGGWLMKQKIIKIHQLLPIFSWEPVEERNNRLNCLLARLPKRLIMNNGICSARRKYLELTISRECTAVKRQPWWHACP